MTPGALLDRLTALGASVALTPEGTLRYRGPAVRVSDDAQKELETLKGELPAHKPALVALLSAPPLLVEQEPDTPRPDAPQVLGKEPRRLVDHERVAFLLEPCPLGGHHNWLINTPRGALCTRCHTSVPDGRATSLGES